MKNRNVVGTITSPIELSPDGLSLKFVLSALLVENLGPGVYQIRVSNDNGSSNVVDFSIVVATTVCTDSDGGKNYYVKGYVKGIDRTGREYIYYDECLAEKGYTRISDKSLYEYFCTPEGFNTREEYVCPHGCKDGACIKEPAPSITVISPNGGERWVRNSKVTDSLSWGVDSPEQIKDIIWIPTPSREEVDGTRIEPPIIEVYLLNLNKIRVGRILPFAYGSLKWVVGVVSRPDCSMNYDHPNYCWLRKNLFLVDPGQYYVEVRNRLTNQSDQSDAPFSIVAPASVTDLELKSISRGTDFHPYGFYAEFCVHGPKSINDLKRENPRLRNFPAAYYVYDSFGRQYRGPADMAGEVEDLKNGQCSGRIGWTIQPSEQPIYNQTKRVDYVLDPDNLIPETNENNNKASFSEPVTPSITVISPNGGERWEIGKTYTISFRRIYEMKDPVSIYLRHYFGDKTVGLIASNVVGSTYDWTVPSSLGSTSLAGGSYVIHITSGKFPYEGVYDHSDAPFSIVAPAREDRVSGTLSVDKTRVKVGEPITLTITAKDAQGVIEVMAFYHGRWHSQSCEDKPECTKTFTFTETTPRTKEYHGYVIGRRLDGTREEAWTTPRSVRVEVSP